MLLTSGGFVSKQPKLIEIQLVQDPRGSLGVIETGKQVDFEFRRFYFITDMPADSERGGHAHKRLQQMLVALRGSVVVELTDGKHQYSFTLNSYDRGLLIPPGFWRVLKKLSRESLIGVLASEPYDESDYIREFDSFSRWSREQRSVNSVSFLPLGRYMDPAYVGKLPGDLIGAMRSVAASARYIGGPPVEHFESEFATYCGVEHAVGVANGMEALQLALLSEGIGPGDQVAVPAHTFAATALAVVQVGAEPVLVDIEEDTGLLDVTKLEAVITPRTRAVIPVHLYGHPVDMDPLLTIARRRGLIVVEDAAQAHGAKYRNRKVGSLGDIAAFSFYPTKNLGAMGDAGAVVTDDAGRAKLVRSIANYGSTVRYHHDRIGMNSRLDPIQAAVLSEKLPHLDLWNARRRYLAKRYLDAFAELDGIALPAARPWADPVWHVFAIRVRSGRKDGLATYLAANGIGTNMHYPVPVHRQVCFADRPWAAGRYPVANRLANEVISLPLDPLHSDAEIDFVIQKVTAFFRMC